MIKSCFTCPSCGENLIKKDHSYYCCNGHCFDIAKEGYVNLLITNKKGEAIGDNKEMIKARRDFLKLGHYKDLGNKVVEVINKYKNKDSIILDCGCGSGYYSHMISENRQGYKDTLLGIDISKEGIKLASKLTPNISFAVASAYKLPLKDNSVDVIVSIFAPYALDEMKRVIKDDGIVILVSPNTYHLWELKQSIYGDKTLEKEFGVTFDSFNIIEKINLNFSFVLNNKEEVDNLITMTPYVYKTPKELLNRAHNIIGKKIQADFLISILTK